MLCVLSVTCIKLTHNEDAMSCPTVRPSVRPIVSPATWLISRTTDKIWVNFTFSFHIKSWKVETHLICVMKEHGSNLGRRICQFETSVVFMSYPSLLGYELPIRMTASSILPNSPHKVWCCEVNSTHDFIFTVDYSPWRSFLFLYLSPYSSRFYDYFS
jgi:hypothetical protein